MHLAWRLQLGSVHAALSIVWMTTAALDMSDQTDDPYRGEPPTAPSLRILSDNVDGLKKAYKEESSKTRGSVNPAWDHPHI